MTAAAVIFDLDGTLVDSLGDIADAANHALAQLGLPPHREEDYARFVGEGVDRLVEKVLGPGAAHRREELLAIFRPYYGAHMMDRSRPFPGIPEVLAELAARGVRLAVLSNKPEAATQRMVTALFPSAPFAIVAGDVPHLPRKPDPGRALAMAAELGVAPARCLFVGDTRIDVLTAAGAGMVPIGVSWGFRPRAELTEAGARVVIDHASELMSCLNLII